MQHMHQQDPRDGTHAAHAYVVQAQAGRAAVALAAVLGDRLPRERPPATAELQHVSALVDTGRGKSRGGEEPVAVGEARLPWPVQRRREVHVRAEDLAVHLRPCTPTQHDHSAPHQDNSPTAGHSESECAVSAST